MHAQTRTIHTILARQGYRQVVFVEPVQSPQAVKGVVDTIGPVLRSRDVTGTAFPNFSKERLPSAGSITALCATLRRAQREGVTFMGDVDPLLLKLEDIQCSFPAELWMTEALGHMDYLMGRPHLVHHLQMSGAGGLGTRDVVSAVGVLGGKGVRAGRGDGGSAGSILTAQAA